MEDLHAPCHDILVDSRKYLKSNRISKVRVPAYTDDVAAFWTV